MKLEQRLSVCVLLLLCVTQSADGGNILVWYTDYSHWINMKPVLESLVDRGHQVTVLVLSTSKFVNTSEPARFGYEPFNVSVSMENVEKFFEDYLHFSMYEIDHMTYLQIYIRYMDVMKVDLQYSLKYLDGVVKSETIMKKLKEGKYDILLANPMYLGGDLVADITPKSKDMEEFVQSSGDAGIVVFTLGSFIKNITSQRGNMIASALAQIPQKVLWRYRGEKPATLGANTRIYDWIPQNDLLGHPKTRAFITHGGSNGIYEAIYHGVPMVGIPMFADQPGNMVHMKAKGAAVIVDLNFMKAEDLRDAINTVINDKSYKENVMQLSRIHHNRPMSPLDEAVFWIEHTIRNKGAEHLRVQAHELTWYQYHSLDVLAFLLAIVLLLVLLFIKTCSFCFWRCCGRKRKTKRKAE